MPRGFCVSDVLGLTGMSSCQSGSGSSLVFLLLPPRHQNLYCQTFGGLRMDAEDILQNDIRKTADCIKVLLTNMRSSREHAPRYVYCQ